MKESAQAGISYIRSVADKYGIAPEFFQENDIHVHIPVSYTHLLERKTGARGLRSIMEKSLMDLMYRTPSDNTICKCIITKDAVDGTGEPEVVHGEQPAVPVSYTHLDVYKRQVAGISFLYTV